MYGSWSGVSRNCSGVYGVGVVPECLGAFQCAFELFQSIQYLLHGVWGPFWSVREPLILHLPCWELANRLSLLSHLKNKVQCKTTKQRSTQYCAQCGLSLVVKHVLERLTTIGGGNPFPW